MRQGKEATSTSPAAKKSPQPQPVAKSGSKKKKSTAPEPKKDSSAASDHSASSKQGPGRLSIGAKFSGKSASEILDPVGLSAVRADVEGMIKTLQAPPFTTALIGKDLEAFESAASEVVKSSKVSQSKLSLMQNKVTKWIEVPDNVSTEIKNWRSKLCSIADVASSGGSKFDLDSTKLEAAMASLELHHHIEAPSCFKVKLFTKRALDMSLGWYGRYGMALLFAVLPFAIGPVGPVLIECVDSRV